MDLLVPKLPQVKKINLNFRPPIFQDGVNHFSLGRAHNRGTLRHPPWTVQFTVLVFWNLLKRRELPKIIIFLQCVFSFPSPPTPPAILHNFFKLRLPSARPVQRVQSLPDVLFRPSSSNVPFFFCNSPTAIPKYVL